MRTAWLALALALAAPAAARAATLCTVIADAADGRVVLERGDCDTRVTPASTFKIPLAAMGFDSGLLADAHHPVLPFREGDVDWGGEAWRQPTDPTRWLRFSVVWYSQRLTRQLGAARLADYATRFGFGNADFSGDPGRDNGLERAWIISSLQVSPLEQVAFLRRLVNGTLPISPHAIEQTRRVVEPFPAPGGWAVHGKTGAAFPRRPDGSFDEARGYGWFVGWAEREGRTLLFARLIQDEGPEPGTPGVRARAAFLAELPALLGE